ncbi:MAG TPA: TrkA family potassium uptake protein [Thermoleophilaceae bacterium]|nr:TrkA family potassium uptake protein [Thermoleophilaceae bacterium]
MRVLIVGAERLGGVLAGDLLHVGHEVRLLDDRGERLVALPEGFGGETVEGSPLDRPTLRDAATGCDAVATVTSDDCLNAVVALAAKREFHVPLAVAVISNPRRADALAGLGAHIVCPTTWTARELHSILVRSGVEGELLLGDDVGVYRAEIPSRLAGRTLAELERPGELIPLAVERGGRLLMAMPGLEVAHGDVLHVAAGARDHVTDLVRP